jgi:hypothetical protein
MAPSQGLRGIQATPVGKLSAEITDRVPWVVLPETTLLSWEAWFIGTFSISITKECRTCR